MDSGSLLIQEEAVRALKRSSRPLVLALIDAAHLQTIQHLLSESVQDFLVRPFTAAELLLRTGRLLQQNRSASMEEFAVGDYRIHMRTWRVHRCDQPLPITRKEAMLLCALARRQVAIARRDELLNEVAGSATVSGSNENEPLRAYGAAFSVRSRFPAVGHEGWFLGFRYVVCIRRFHYVQVFRRETEEEYPHYKLWYTR